MTASLINLYSKPRFSVLLAFYFSLRLRWRCWKMMVNLMMSLWAFRILFLLSQPHQVLWFDWSLQEVINKSSEFLFSQLMGSDEKTGLVVVVLMFKCKEWLDSNSKRKGPTLTDIPCHSCHSLAGKVNKLDSWINLTRSGRASGNGHGIWGM